MDIFESFYLTGVMILSPLWLIMFLRNKSKKDMILIGAISGIVSVIYGQFFSNNDYWNPSYIIPNFPLEDFLYGWILGGISSELYEFIFGRRNSLRRTHKKIPFIFFWFLVIPIILSIITVLVFQMNSIFALIISPLISGVIMVVHRRDLLIPSIVNGILVLILTIVGFNILLLIFPNLFTENWMIASLSGLSFLNIPLEELLFALCFGFSVGMLYEATFGYSSVSIKKDK